MQNPFNPVQVLLALHARGQFAEMERQARQALRGNSNAAILNELVGIALTGQKKFSEALPFLQKAVRREARDALFWENLGLCQRELRQFSHAEKSLREALKLLPGNVETLNTLGSVLREQKRHEEAQQAFEEALKIAPDHGPAHFNLGRHFARLKQFEKAEPYLQKAIQLGQQLEIAHRLLGFVLLKLDKFVEAERHLRRALQLDPDYYLTFALLARTCHELGRKQEAIGLVRQAFDRLGDIREAVKEGATDGLDSFAEQLCDMSFVFDALRILEVTAAHDKNHSRAFMAVHSARHVCRWDLSPGFEAQALDFDRELPSIVNPFVSLYMAGAIPEKQLIIARKYAAQFVKDDAASGPVARPSIARSERIRVGYLSSDFHQHATSIILAGVIEAHDRDRFEIVAYDHSDTTPGEYRDRMMRAFDSFVPVHQLDDNALVRRIAEDGIDIMMDIKGWTRGSRSRALAAKPAPVQVQWFGTPGTLGAPWIDYIVADEIVVPRGYETFYSEKMLRLPDCYWPNDDKREKPLPPPRGQCGLPENAFVFACFNQIHKVTPEIFDVWMRLLRARDGAVLWLLASDARITDVLRREAETRGVDPLRLIFAAQAPVSEHLARLANTDLALDCFPYTSHTTAVDMLWMGVPLVALSGETFASRVSESLLATADLGDLVTRSFDDYYDLALRLAKDADALAMMKARAGNCRTSALFDTKRFTRNLERGLELIWQRHFDDLPPDHIDVPPTGGA
jgi:predicted O-linked N-acetylglucosamine transferase (SPINDLY family)